MKQEIVKSNSLFAQLAKKYNITEKELINTLKNTIMKPSKTGREATDAEVIAFGLVASKYDLNPFTKEIYAFPDKRSGIVPIVGVDGFITLANRQKDFNGYEVSWSETIITNDGAKPCPEWCEIKLHRKDREYPIITREYLDEVYREPFVSEKGYKVSGPWQTHTKRMLRHKTLIQALRIGFGFVGIYDEDEAIRIIEASEDIPQIQMKPEVQIPKSIADKAEKTPPEPNMSDFAPINELSAKHEALEELAIIAFNKKKQDWFDFIGQQYGVEQASELTDHQIEECTKLLNEKIKDAKKE